MYTFVQQGINAYKKALEEYKRVFVPLAIKDDEQNKLKEELKDSVPLYVSEQVAKAKLKGMEEALGLNEEEITKYKMECGVEI